jgi:hypothetical protein
MFYHKEKEFSGGPSYKWKLYGKTESMENEAAKFMEG